jgi:hypothetical protein
MNGHSDSASAVDPGADQTIRLELPSNKLIKTWIISICIGIGLLGFLVWHINAELKAARSWDPINLTFLIFFAIVVLGLVSLSLFPFYEYQPTLALIDPSARTVTMKWRWVFGEKVRQYPFDMCQAVTLGSEVNLEEQMLGYYGPRIHLTTGETLDLHPLVVHNQSRAGGDNACIFFGEKVGAALSLPLVGKL